MAEVATIIAVEPTVTVAATKMPSQSSSWMLHSH